MRRRRSQSVSSSVRITAMTIRLRSVNSATIRIIRLIARHMDIGVRNGSTAVCSSVPVRGTTSISGIPNFTSAGGSVDSAIATASGAVTRDSVVDSVARIGFAATGSVVDSVAVTMDSVGTTASAVTVDFVVVKLSVAATAASGVVNPSTAAVDSAAVSPSMAAVDSAVVSPSMAAVDSAVVSPSMAAVDSAAVNLSMAEEAEEDSAVVNPSMAVVETTAAEATAAIMVAGN